MSGDHNQTDPGWRKRQIALDKKAENARELGLDYEPDKTVIEMAREAGLIVDANQSGFDSVVHFAELVRADERSSWPAEMEAMERQVNILTDALAQERDRLKWDVHSCGPTCNRYACVAVREAVQAEREHYDALFESIKNWCEAYPISVFPEPDFKKAHEVLKANGMTLDAISASNMKHVITQVQKMIDTAIRARGNT